jgi:hypothetical protein
VKGKNETKHGCRLCMRDQETSRLLRAFWGNFNTAQVQEV